MIRHSNFPPQSTTDEVICNGNNDILEKVLIDTGDCDQLHVKWNNDSVGDISIDASS